MRATSSSVSNTSFPLIGWVALLSRRSKQLLSLLTDASLIPAVMWAALSLKAGTLVPLSAGVLRAMGLAAVLSIAAFAWCGLYRAVLRFLGPGVAVAMASSVAIVLLGLFGVQAAGLLPSIDKSAVLIFGALLSLYVATTRMSFRWLVLAHRAARSNVVVYGAGDAGASLVAALASTGQFTPVAFIDDNPSLKGSVIAGIRVFGTDDLPWLMRAYSVKRVLLAMPVLSRRRRREILEHLDALGVHVQTMPSISDLVAGAARVDDVRDVDTADLLGRDPVPPSMRLFEKCIRGKTVLVTGAGGSIGSELCRQILGLAPKRLLLLEMSELALYNIDRDLRFVAQRQQIQSEIVALLGNAHHKYRVREILQTFGVETVYHAAAYKHVPIVERNVIEGLHNNVFSTWYAAEAALECEVETFVLISTDKAVNPTNVMGATKRFAEIVLQGLQERSSKTRFCMVRFGNVLESSGSVVPLFREQIQRGGPITVTHPDVIRYFMTIPEAAQLVIQAGAMATGGDVFVLDMGKPVRIVDLARRMVQLSGLSVRDAENPEGDIEIVYTGLRPAEKLFEELLIGKNVMGTEHPMIMRAVEHALPWARVQHLLEHLGIAMRRFDCPAAREILQQAVSEYAPTEGIQDLVWVRRAEVFPPSRAMDVKVADLQARRSKQPPP